MLDIVRTLLPFGDGAVGYECRRCGTSVDTADDECPTCGSAEIAEYATE